MARSIEAEIDRNFAVFQDVLSEYLPEHRGRYMLMHNQEIVRLFDKPGDADRAGYEQFGPEPYSVQLISDEPIDLGFYSYAATQRDA